MSDDDDAHIFFSFEETPNSDTPNSDTPNSDNVLASGDVIAEMLGEGIYSQLDADISFPHMINYSENSTIKELLTICEYYGFAKELKSNKCSKGQIIQILVDFEMNLRNNEIVCKRRALWFYINELKRDKFMKKFILW
jgi:hypothetical protein